MLREEERQSKKFIQAATLSPEEPADFIELVFCVHEMHLQIFNLYVCVHIYIKNTLYLWLDAHVFFDVSVWFFMH